MISNRKPWTFKSFLRYGEALTVSISSKMDCFILHVPQISIGRKQKSKPARTYSLIAINCIVSTSSSFSGPARSLSFFLIPSSVMWASPQSVRTWHSGQHSVQLLFPSWKGREKFVGHYQYDEPQPQSPPPPYCQAYKYSSKRQR